MQRVRKAVIPAAGFGTRFLPASKSVPKQMFPIVDKPIIQIIVEELVDAGIEDIIIVTSHHLKTLEDHFDKPTTDLVENLKMGGEKKRPLLEEVERIGNLANFIYVRQKGPYGNGTPLLNVASIVGNEPFLYTWSDDFIYSPKGASKQLIETYEEYECSVLSGIPLVKEEDYLRCGFSSGKDLGNGVMDVETLIEKPGKEKAPSNIMNVSSFLLTPDIFTYTGKAAASRKEENELYYNDILNLMLSDKKRIVTKEIAEGVWYDMGNKLEYLKTTIEFALRNPEVSEDLTTYLKTLKLR